MSDEFVDYINRQWKDGVPSDAEIIEALRSKIDDLSYAPVLHILNDLVVRFGPSAIILIIKDIEKRIEEDGK